MMPIPANAANSSPAQRPAVGSHGKYGSIIGRQVGTVRFFVVILGLFLMIRLLFTLLYIFTLLLEALKLVLVVFHFFGRRLFGSTAEDQSSAAASNEGEHLCGDCRDDDVKRREGYCDPEVAPQILSVILEGRSEVVWSADRCAAKA